MARKVLNFDILRFEPLCHHRPRFDHFVLGFASIGFCGDRRRDCRFINVHRPAYHANERLQDDITTNRLSERGEAVARGGMASCNVPYAVASGQLLRSRWLARYIGGRLSRQARTESRRTAAIFLIAAGCAVQNARRRPNYAQWKRELIAAALRPARVSQARSWTC